MVKVKSNKKRIFSSSNGSGSGNQNPYSVIAIVASVMVLAYCYTHLDLLKNINETAKASKASKKSKSSSSKQISYKSPLAYGTKSGGIETAQLIKDAIHKGFRHIVTGGHHQAHNETGVGIGWKASGVSRNEIFLETCFVPWSGRDFQKQVNDPEQTPATIQEQVHLSIQTSLKNLQTTYIDAVVFHNFRAKLHPFEEMIQAWKILEEYVNKGIIHTLGIVSVHDMNYLERLFNESTIQPSIVQNRFHSNRGYDIQNQPTFKTHKELQIQRFWLLNGSSGGGRGNKDMAERKGVTPQQLLLGFVMSLGSQTCLVGTHSLEHMKDDVEMANCYPYIFDNEEERQEYAKKLGYRPSNWDLYDPILPIDQRGEHKDYASCKAQLSSPTT